MKSFRKQVGGEVRFSIPTNSPCPCGSGKPASQCCLTEKGFKKTPASTAPTPPVINHSLEFGRADFSNEQGLYICRYRGYEFEGPYGLRMQTITGKGRLTGMGLWVCGYELILSMSGFPSRIFDGREFFYRPLELYATGKEFEKSVVMLWEGLADKGTVKLEIDQIQQ